MITREGGDGARGSLRRASGVRAVDVLLLGTVPGGLLAVSGLSGEAVAPGAAGDTGVLSDVWLSLGLAMPLWACWRFVASMPAGEPLALGRLTGLRVTRTVLGVVATMLVLLVALLVTGGAVTVVFLAGTMASSSTSEGVAGPWLVAAVSVVVLVTVVAGLDRVDRVLRSRAEPAASPPKGQRLPWYDLAVPVVLALGAVVLAALATGGAGTPVASEGTGDRLVFAVLALLVAASWAGWRVAATLPDPPPP